MIESPDSMFFRSPQAGHIGPLLFIRLLVALPPIPPVFAHAGRAMKIQTDAPLRVRPCLKAIYRKAASPYFFLSRSSYSASVFACTFSAMALLASVAAVCLACVVSAVEGVHHVLPKIQLRMLHMHHMPKAYDVFLQKPSGVLPENVEIVGIGIDFCLSGLVCLPQNPLVHKDRHHF